MFHMKCENTQNYVFPEEEGGKKQVEPVTVPSTNIGTLDKYEQRRLWK